MLFFHLLANKFHMFLRGKKENKNVKSNYILISIKWTKRLPFFSLVDLQGQLSSNLSPSEKKSKKTTCKLVIKSASHCVVQNAKVKQNREKSSLLHLLSCRELTSFWASCYLKGKTASQKKVKWNPSNHKCSVVYKQVVLMGLRHAQNKFQVRMESSLDAYCHVRNQHLWQAPATKR